MLLLMPPLLPPPLLLLPPPLFLLPPPLLVLPSLSSLLLLRTLESGGRQHTPRHSICAAGLFPFTHVPARIHAHARIHTRNAQYTHARTRACAHAHTRMCARTHAYIYGHHLCRIAKAMCLGLVRRYSTLVADHFLNTIEGDPANFTAARDSLPRISSLVR